MSEMKSEKYHTLINFNKGKILNSLECIKQNFDILYTSDTAGSKSDKSCIEDVDFITS